MSLYNIFVSPLTYWNGLLYDILILEFHQYMPL